MKFQLDATVGKGSWPQPGCAFVQRDTGERWEAFEPPNRGFLPETLRTGRKLQRDNLSPGDLRYCPCIWHTTHAVLPSLEKPESLNKRQRFFRCPDPIVTIQIL